MSDILKRIWRVLCKPTVAGRAAGAIIHLWARKSILETSALMQIEEAWKPCSQCFGTVEDDYIVTDRQTVQSKGFGFVMMGSDTEAQAAIQSLNGKQCGEDTVIVNEAKSQG